MPRFPKSAQETYVTTALALGLMELRVKRIEGNKFRFDMSFKDAWRDFPHRGDFPAIARDNGVDPYYQIVTEWRTKTRYIPSAAFYDAKDGAHEPRLRRGHDTTLAECIDELEEDSGIRWEDWQKLAADFVESYGDE